MEHEAHGAGWNDLHLLWFAHLEEGRKAAEGLGALIERGWHGAAQGWHLIHQYVLSKYVERERENHFIHPLSWV